MTEKIPISFNDQDIARVKELADLMGIGGVYGDFPKAVKFGINLALAAIRTPCKVYSDLDAAELDFYFQSVKRSHLKQKMLKESQNLVELAQKV